MSLALPVEIQEQLRAKREAHRWDGKTVPIPQPQQSLRGGIEQ